MPCIVLWYSRCDTSLYSGNHSEFDRNKAHKITALDCCWSFCATKSSGLAWLQRYQGRYGRRYRRFLVFPAPSEIGFAGHPLRPFAGPGGEQSRYPQAAGFFCLLFKHFQAAAILANPIVQWLCAVAAARFDRDTEK